MVGPVVPQQVAPGGPDQIFVGRSGELHALRANLGWARAGEPRMVLISGPPGIGKSALIRAFLAQTGSAARSLSGCGAEAEAGVPFGVLQQLLEGTELRSADLGGDTDPFNTGARLVDVLGVLQDTGPVVLAVDDVHWADTLSMRALTFALRRLDADRVLTVLAYDDGHPDLPGGVHQLAEGRGESLRLGGLDAIALAELAVRKGAGRLPVAAAERFCHYTGGNPLHAGALIDQLDPVDLRRADTLPPSSYATVVTSRLAACAPATRALVAAAAVLGERCSLATAARLAGLDDASAALEEAVHASLLDGEPGRSISFVHPSTRDAVYRDLDPGRRIALHTRAATLTAGRAVLDHRVAATTHDDAAVAEELGHLAAAETARRLWVLAAGHFEAAARLTPDALRREGFVLDAAENRLRAGEQQKAVGLLEQATLDSARRRYLFGHLAVVSGRLEEGRRLFEEAWEVEPDPVPLLAIELAQLALVQARADDAVTWGLRAMASAGDDADAHSAARSVVGIGLAVGGRGEEALTLLDEPPVAASDLSADPAGVLVRGVVHSLLENLSAASTDLAAVASAGAGGRSLPFRVYGLACLARTEYLLGRWDDSAGHADLAVSLAQDADQARALSLCRSVATLTLAARGEWDQAVAHAQALALAAEESGADLELALAANAAAHVAFARRDPVGIVAAVEPVLDLWGKEGLNEPTVLTWPEQYADALVSLGHLDEAAAVVARLTATAAALGRRSSLAGAVRVKGRLEAARGNLEPAESAFEDALAFLEGVPIPFSRALVEEAHGGHLRRTGQSRAAAAHLRSARATFADLGARPFLERCDRELAACGLSPGPGAGRAPVALTPLELATARLAASGCSIREVAGQLVVSVKTAEHHLNNVYTKLAISSPHRLAAALAGRNLG